MLKRLSKAALRISLITYWKSIWVISKSIRRRKGSELSERRRRKRLRSSFNRMRKRMRSWTFYCDFYYDHDVKVCKLIHY